jgi:hypothetical protein
MPHGGAARVPVAPGVRVPLAALPCSSSAQSQMFPYLAAAAEAKRRVHPERANL